MKPSTGLLDLLPILATILQEISQLRTCFFWRKITHTENNGWEERQFLERGRGESQQDGSLTTIRGSVRRIN
jgi:hypothetical protein